MMKTLAMPKAKARVKEERVSKKPMTDAERERVIQEFLPIIKYMALRMAMRVNHGLQVDDLMSAGTVGLLDALNKFDPTREIKFRTYAEFRIRGAMLDEIRAMDWVPRSVRERIVKIQQASTALTKRNGRPPTDEELAKHVGMDPVEVDETLLQAKGSVMLSLDDLGVDEEEAHTILDFLPDTDQEDPLESLLSEDARKILAESIDRLPERQRMVLTLYYFEELTMKEIGVIMSVTESRVCQLHSQAMIRLRAQLQAKLQE